MRIVAALLLAPSRVHACAVCFGGAADNQALFSGLTWGLFFLLGFTFFLLGGLAMTVVRIERKRAEAERALR